MSRTLYVSRLVDLQTEAETRLKAMGADLLLPGTDTISPQGIAMLMATQFLSNRYCNWWVGAKEGADMAERRHILIQWDMTRQGYRAGSVVITLRAPSTGRTSKNTWYTLRRKFAWGRIDAKPAYPLEPLYQFILQAVRDLLAEYAPVEAPAEEVLNG